MHEEHEKEVTQRDELPALEALCLQNIMKLDLAALEEARVQLRHISKELIAQSPQACLTAFCIALRSDRLEEARHWYSQLAALRDAQKEGTRERASVSQYLCCVGMMLPKVDNARLLLMLAILFHEYQGRYKLAGPLPLCVTGQRPSVLRGAKDLSEWGRNYRAVASIVEPMLTALFADKNHGLASAAVAELLYEYNDLTAASAEVAAALSCAMPEVAFAGMAQVARISRASAGDGKRMTELLRNMERLLADTGATELTRAYQALCVRFEIHEGHLEPVQAWLERCGIDELHCTHDRSYELMTQAQAQIAVGHPRDAVTLLERILLVLREDFCPLDTMECLAHCAVACELLGDRDRALDKLEEALRMAEPYRYVRVIADRGAVMLRLLSQLHKESARLEGLSGRYLHTVLEATKSYALLRPALYSRVLPQETGSCPSLTPMEIQILHLLEEGKSNREIGDILEIKVPTVKFHLANLFEKLGVPNRTTAIKVAKDLHLL